MSDAPTIGLALIARDEESTLPGLLDSIQGAFDRVVLVDTGSEDKTVEVFESWAADEVGEGRLESYLCDHFKWVDDFSAARRYADSLLGCDWSCWSDADDRIEGAEHLRTLAAQAPPDLAAYIAGYDYARDEHGNCACYLRRERLVRAGHGRWEGRVHEAQIIEGRAEHVPPDTVEWVHRKQPEEVQPERNLRILRAWVQDEPENPRVLGYLGTEEMSRGNHEAAVDWFHRYLALKIGWDEECAQIHRKLGMTLGALDRHDEAIATALEAVLLLPTWPDSYLTLAEAHYNQGELPKCIYWADEAMRRGVPLTLLIINPLDYTVAPRVVKAAALAGLGALAEAITLGEEVLGIVPGHPMAATWQAWRGQRKAESTAEAFISAAAVLVAHDEQLKALAVLEAVPHFATDHPQVVAHRSQIRERLAFISDVGAYAEHYETGGSQPEDMVPDDKVLELGDALPRCSFLLRGLEAQVSQAAA